MDMSKYKGMFISETNEHLLTMNQLIISLEKDPSSQENIESLFREAHSIKGMSASMGYDQIAELSHKMEDMMDLFRKGELVLNSNVVDILFEGLDNLELMVKGIEDDQPANIDCSSLIKKFEAVKTGDIADADKRGATAPPEKKPVKKPEKKVVNDKKKEIALSQSKEENNKITVDIKIESSSQIPGMRGFLVFKCLNDLGTVIETNPGIDEVKKGNFDNKIRFILATDGDIGEIEALLGKMAELATFKVSKDTERDPENDGPISREDTGEISLSSSQGDEIRKVKSPVRKSSHQVRTVRVTTDLLDNLINIVGEMIISRSRLFEISKEIESSTFHEGLMQMSNHIRDLHGQVMSVRMTPIESLMERLPRVVRDLARKDGKKIELIIEGKDIELDRAIVDEMGDPLVHILRNSVDHGIEPPEERESSGKDPTGQIRIRAMREKDQVYISIEDDGRGMNVEKIKRKALARGLIKKDRINTISDKEAFMFVCHPGLSTADKVTDVSGRGVGMDAAKNVVDSIGGSLDIDSTVGKGTIITLKLPLTVAIMHVLLVGLNSDVLAIPISKIISTFEVEKQELKRSQKQLAILVEGELIPLLSLKKILNIKGDKQPAHPISVVVVEMKNKKIGLVVDEFVDQQEAFVKPLLPPLEWVKGFSGATILGDGSVIFVVDIPNLL